MVKGHQHSLLDEVDLIAGVSGGSFTALAYALYGERLFQEYQQRFLKRNVQGELIQRILNPTNWLRLAIDSYGRSELAADYYDEILFGGATFSDVIPLKTPVAVVSGTDLSTGARFHSRRTPLISCVPTSGRADWPARPRRRRQSPFFSFQLPIVTTAGTVNAMLPIWSRTLRTRNTRPARPDEPCCAIVISRRSRIARTVPTSHIVDGAVSDNLGLRSMLEAFEQLEASPAFQREMRSPNCAILS